MPNYRNPDFLIIGAGIMGLTLALEMLRRYPKAVVSVIEKEKYLAAHASGRNSGVLHAGFYYTADSLKAKLTQKGNQEMTSYCLNKEIPINKCGKLVVAQGEKDLETLNILYERGKKNQVPLEMITAEQTRKIEPRAKTYQRALFSPTTSSLDPVQVMHSLKDDLSKSGGHLYYNAGYIKREGKKVDTTQGRFSPGYVINTAGLYADKIARDYSLAKNISILPFKGLYFYSGKEKNRLGCHIYPVPDLRNPFLGVHLTVTVSGQVKIGPTAIPCLWRENYNGWKNLRLSELKEIFSLEACLFYKNDFGFRRLALQELKKYYRPNLVGQAGKLVRDIKSDQFNIPGKPGIRAQPIDLINKKLLMDFYYQGDNHSFHLLNAVSPAFTCSFPLSRYLAQEIEKTF